MSRFSVFALLLFCLMVFGSVRPILRASSMDELFEKTGFTCRSWKQILEDFEIKTCSQRTLTSFISPKALEAMPGDESAVVVDGGARAIFHRPYRCNGSTYEIRFSYDEANGFCGYEVFFKKGAKELYALAVAEKGDLFRIVPTNLAEAMTTMAKSRSGLLNNFGWGNSDHLRDRAQAKA